MADKTIYWTGDWVHRLGLIEYEVNKLKHFLRNQGNQESWKELHGLGRVNFGKDKFDNTYRYITTGCIEDVVHDSFGVTVDNSCCGFTQHTEEFTYDSYRNRLDRNSGLPDSSYLLELLKAT